MLAATVIALSAAPLEGLRPIPLQAIKPIIKGSIRLRFNLLAMRFISFCPNLSLRRRWPFFSSLLRLGDNRRNSLCADKILAMIKKTFFAPGLLMALLLLSAAAFAQPPRTMRVDYYHTGNATQELFSLDRVVVEPLAWPGNPQKAIDETNLGKYLFDVRDRNTNRLLYSRGFASIYGEWETTDEAKSMNRTFHESLRFPVPSAAVQVALKKRDAMNAFREIWSLVVDPKDMFIDSAAVQAQAPLIEIEKNGDP